jgi:hypothetical protein
MILEIYRIEGEEGLEQVPTVKEISTWSDFELRTEITIINNKITGRYDIVKNTGRVTESNRARLTAKYQSLYLSWILMELDDDNNTDVNNIIEEMFHYALSIKYDKDRTPKYVRVIDNS